jgi:hypothetical protein
MDRLLLVREMVRAKVRVRIRMVKAVLVMAVMVKVASTEA